MSRIFDQLGPRPRMTLVICEQQVAEIWVEGRAPLISIRDYDWGETDPEELLQWWLRIAAERKAWCSIGRKHASAVRSLSWRESMRKLLMLVEELPSP